MKIFPVFILIFTSLISINAQSEMDAIIKNIVKNNTSIQLQKSIINAEKIEYKIGSTLYDPYVSIDFMRGSPFAVAGNQTDINIAQQFDFPTKYNKQKALIKDQVLAADLQESVHTQSLISEVRLIYNTIIYHNKKEALLLQKKAKAENLVNAYQAKLDRGEGNKLDVNKAKLLVLETNKEYNENKNMILYLEQVLAEYNGGNNVTVKDTIYPDNSIKIEAEEQLINDVVKMDFQSQLLQQQLGVLKSELEVNKAANMPKFDLGYHYQGILGQNFHGAKLGVSIPVWENKYKVDYKNAQINSQENLMQEHRFKIENKLKRSYDKYIQLSKIKDEYLLSLQSINSQPLLEKALKLGEISLIEYLYETKYIFETNATYLDLERECNELIIEMTKYKRF